MEKQSKILITGASGLIGSALVRLLRDEGYENFLIPTRWDMDCRFDVDVQNYFFQSKPEYVFHLAARVGGIQENDNYSARFIYENTAMHCNIFEACREFSIKKLLFPGSACAYPALDRPIKESDFLQGPPEPTNLAYAVAKQNGIVMAQSYAKQYDMKVVLPMVTNAYGPGDRSSHVIPMMVEKFKKMKPIFWGTGKPLREFIHADDVATAFLFLMLNYESSEIINVGTEEEITIRGLANKIYNLVNKSILPIFDDSKLDGVARKVLDSSKLRALGWGPKITLDEGLRSVINERN